MRILYRLGTAQLISVISSAWVRVCRGQGDGQADMCQMTCRGRPPSAILTILPGWGVWTNEFRSSQAVAEPAGKRRSPPPWGRQGAFTRSGTDRLRCPPAFRVTSARSGATKKLPASAMRTEAGTFRMERRHGSYRPGGPDCISTFAGRRSQCPGPRLRRRKWVSCRGWPAEGGSGPFPCRTS